MAHADIFERISRNSINDFKENRTEIKEKAVAMDKKTTIDDKAIETIKLLGKQILEIRDHMDEQTKTIDALRKELNSLKQGHDDTNGNLKLITIDQQDVSKQLKSLRSIVNSQQLVDSRIGSTGMGSNIERSMAASKPLTAANIKQASLPESRSISKSTEHSPATTWGNAQASNKMNKSQAGSANQASLDQDMAYQEITKAINEARKELGLAPHDNLIGAIKANSSSSSQKAASKPVHDSKKIAKSKAAEDTAKEFIFGRLPKLLNLD